MLPVKEFFDGGKLSRSGVYDHHRRWVLDISSMQPDGPQSLCKKQDDAIGYQGRKKPRTTNALFLCDNAGQPLAVATPQSGEHNDLYAVEALFTELCDLVKEAGIELDGVL